MALIGAMSLPASGHAPYGQWGIYRKRYLLILTTREDPTGYELGSRIAEALAERLPDSRARVSRAPHRERIASLISSKQMDVALLSRDDAAALRQGLPPFTAYGPLPIHAIIGIDNYLLVCRDDFPARHAWLIADALSKAGRALPVALSPVAPTGQSLDPRVPLHPGTQAYYSGRQMPEHETEADHDEEHGHR